MANTVFVINVVDGLGNFFLRKEKESYRLPPVLTFATFVEAEAELRRRGYTNTTEVARRIGQRHAYVVETETRFL